MALAKKLGSSQSRIAKLEAGARGVTLDLLFRALYARRSVPATALLSGPDLLKLRVYDLYYKMKPTTVDKWWKYVDDGMNGTVEVGLEHDFT